MRYTAHGSAALVGIFVAFIVSVSGCGDDDAGGNNSNSSVGIELDELCDVMVDDLCLVLMQCYEWDYEDLEHCRADQECLGMEALQAEVDAGYVSYDAQAAGACHQRLVNAPCEFGFFLFVPDVYEMLLNCEDVLTGNQAEGDPCVSMADCLPDGVCRPFGSCPGACVTMALEGELCDDDVGPECDYREDLECVGGTCVSPAGLGQSCVSTSGCAEDLWCNQVSELCEQRATVGETCNNFDGPECTWDLWCDSLFDTGTCHDLSGAGEICLYDEHCEEPLACHPDPVDPFAPGSCDPPAGNGADCDTEQDCQAPLVCLNEVCSAAPELGEQCQLDNCAQGLTCEGGTCLNARYPGDLCGDADSVCVNSLCSGSECEPRASLGDTCQDDNDCASRVCEGTVCVDPNDCTP